MDLSDKHVVPLPSRRRFLRQLGAGVAGSCAASGSAARFSWALPAATAPSPRLPRSAPQTQGVAAAGILDFVNAVEAARMNLHSLMVLRRGHVVAEGWWAPYAPDLRHTLYSLSKSFTSTAVGFAVAEGRVKLGDRVVSFFPEEVPEKVTPHLAGMRVNDLLMMAAGHAKEALLSPDFQPPPGDWIRAVLAQPVDFLPGTHFTYNNGASFLLSAIVQKATGQTVLAYLKPRFFDPLGIDAVDWETSPAGINCGGWGLRVRTEDIASLGQFYLQKGRWGERQLLPEAWIEQATRKQIPTAVTADLDQAKAQTSDWAQGYGYQFWRCRLNAYRGDGAFGQFCIVMPKEEAVIALTSETADMQAVLNTVWKHLVPAVRGVRLGDDDDARSADALSAKLASLTLAPPAGQTSSQTVARVDRKTFAIEKNALKVTRARLEFGKDSCAFTLGDAQGEHRIACGLGGWAAGETDLSPVPLKLVPTPVAGETRTRIAAAAAWSDEKTLVMHWRFTETAHYQTVTCRFDGEGVSIEFKKSLSIINPAIKDERPVLVGKY